MQENGAVECLGRSFNSEDERREYFRDQLRKNLPELKQVEGFPIGDDEDIIALSDPPYYTACPNPWLNDFIAEWEKDKETTPGRKKDFRVNEPYSKDLIEGKHHPIYNAHSYHTKVPHPAIMRFLLYYTQPGDIVFDGFSGTGMMGIAANCCDAPEIEIRSQIENEWRIDYGKLPSWGKRNAILSDISTISTFIGYNYSVDVDIDDFIKLATELLSILRQELGWTFETAHAKNKIGQINYVVWSEIQQCPHCASEFNYWNAAVDYNNNIVKEEYNCPKCSHLIKKRNSIKAFKTEYDSQLGETFKIVKEEPVFINYTFAGKRYEKAPDTNDKSIIDRINDLDIKSWYPTRTIAEGDKTGDPFRLGITRVYQFYTKRNLLLLSRLFELINAADCDDRLKNYLRIWFSSSQSRLHKMNRYAAQHGRHVGPMANTLYISATPTEISPFYFIASKIKDNALTLPNLKSAINQVRSATQTGIQDNTIDYIFVDPPFGSNIMYSELNILWESWLNIITNNKEEAIENKTQNKTLHTYQDLMIKSFKEFYRILKPARWMTIEFSNTSAAVWNSIQYSIQKAGFVVASVFALNKGRGGLQAIIGPTAVNQDLMISCYKPKEDFDRNNRQQATDTNLWYFMQEHLNHLPTHIRKEQKTSAIIERSPKILYDRLISFYLMRGLPIPIDAIDFQSGLKQKFIERDGMYFTTEQASEYDEEKAKRGETGQLSLIFDIIYSENDAVQWLKERLRNKSQTYQDIMPEFRKANVVTRKGEKEIELKIVLEENFIQESGGLWRVPDMNEAKDREALRIKALLKEFDRYVTELSSPKSKKLKEVRVEALRAGFKSCWEKKDFHTIVTMGDRIPQNLLLEDEQLLMFYDIAKDRI